MCFKNYMLSIFDLIRKQDIINLMCFTNLFQHKIFNDQNIKSLTKYYHKH